MGFADHTGDRVDGPLEAEALLDSIFRAKLLGDEALPGVGVGEELAHSIA